MANPYKMTPADLASCIDAGMVTKQIAERYGVTRQAVSGRAAKAGLLDRLWANRPIPKHLQPQPPKKFELKYEMPMEMVQLLQSNGATRAFTYQRRNAKCRGIGWEMTLAEWWKIWDESGKWSARGRTKGGWVMGRFGDVGPYSPTNVVICTHSENQAVARSHSVVQFAVPHVKVKKNRWYVWYKRGYYGSFKTKEAAEVVASQIRIDPRAFKSAAQKKIDTQNQSMVQGQGNNLLS